MMWIRRDREKEKGFTLVELMVVMAILAILAALAVPRFVNVLSGAKEDADKANKAILEKAAELYIVQENEDITELTEIKIKEDLIDKGYLKPNKGDNYEGPNGESYKITIIKKDDKLPQIVVEEVTN